MQFVKSTPELCHPIMTEINALYADLSDKQAVKSLVPHTFHKSLKGIVDLFSFWADVHRDFTYSDYAPKRLELEEYDPKTIIVCFSGGKDSFTTARHYQKMGYNVILYHLKGLNLTYRGKYSEHIVAEDVAEYLGMPLVVEEVTYAGTQEWVEHPMKNMLLVNCALSYGIRNHITSKIAVGTFRMSFMRDNAFDVCGGDCEEMWEAYEEVMSNIIPRFKVYRPNINYQTSYNAILKEPEVLGRLGSCMTPTRFRDLFRERTQRNYNMQFLPNRCGCCWKDCLEYIWFTDHGVFELNPEYYIHCVEVLGNTWYKETGQRYYDVTDIWEQYLFYPMKKSIMYKELSHAIVQPNGKIDYTDNDSEG